MLPYFAHKTFVSSILNQAAVIVSSFHYFLNSGFSYFANSGQRQFQFRQFIVYSFHVAGIQYSAQHNFLNSMFIHFIFMQIIQLLLLVSSMQVLYYFSISCSVKSQFSEIMFRQFRRPNIYSYLLVSAYIEHFVYVFLKI